jgi:hypothetical protein
MDFPAAPSNGHRTAVVLTLFGAASLVAVAVMSATQPGNVAFTAVLYLLPTLGLLWLAPRLGRPLRYSVADGFLTVPAHLSPVRLRLAGARYASGTGTGVRMGGSSVPGLYLGRYVDGKGAYHCAATADVGVWVAEGQRRVFVTPADEGAFVAALEAAGAVRGEG